MLLPRDDGTVRLVWELVLRFHDGQRWYQTFVDAYAGAVLDWFNWIDDGAGAVAEGVCASECYDVIALPKESPLDGPITTESAPADATASPFGWHDTNGSAGAEFTDTRGNNVEAQTDLNANNNPAAPDIRGQGGANLVFDAVWDPNSDPNASQEASVNNLFYWNNIMHDVLYQYGFDEAGGNFQQNNYGNGGAAGDPVQADALDGSSTNNANFGTPPDGIDPRMQMFRWLYPFPNLMTINAAPFSSFGGGLGPYIMSGANFGPAFTGETGDIVFADDSTAPDVNDGCQPFAVPAGSIALIRRGNCSFVTKVRNAQNGGAVAAVIQKITGGNPSTLGDDMTGGDITIPSGMVSMADGAELLGALPRVNATIEVDGSPPPDRDSDFDSGVIAHEYGHGVSNRLTGGPGNTGCLSHPERAGEGWSDWWTLTLFPDPSDTAIQARGVGNYLTYGGTEGLGIRNFPYSTDLTVNPQTFISIGSTNIPHGVGEIWAQMLWEVYWLLIDKYGFDADLYVGTGGNNLAIQLVIDGMKMQPCSPTFVQARDAILAADMVNNGSANHCEIWTGFAKRGLGFSASSGGTGVGDEVEAFDFPPGIDPACAAALFTDGFESGDTSAWDEVVP